MAYFSSIDLQDYVRNGFIVEDATGICAQTLPRIEPKTRPGGLPIGFGEPESDDFDDSEVESSSPGFTIDLDSLNVVVKARKSELNGTANVKDVPTKGRVVFKENRALLDELSVVERPELPSTSMISDILAEPSQHFHNEFDVYSVFDMSKHWPSPKLKQVCVVVPFADDKPCIYTLTVPNTATIADLMGLCCFMYTSERRTPEITERQDLLLYLAEDMDADTDFPPIDQNQKMVNCLFTNFALARKPDIEDYREREFKVVVHFTCGLTYVIVVNSLDTPLEIVRDEAVRRKEVDQPNSEHPDFQNLRYVLELIHRPGEPVNLKATLSGIPNLEFVCLRENSARGDFVPPVTNRTLDRSSSLQRIQVTTPTSIKGPMSAGFSQKGFDELNFDVTPPFKTEEYLVERLHRIRPKWSAKLIIHSDAVEITPTHVVRRNIVPQSSPKLTFLEFEVIASCSLSLDHSRGCRQVRITFLSIPNEYFKRAYDIIKAIDAKGSPNGVTGRTSLCSIREGEDNLFRRKTDTSTDTDESAGRRIHYPSTSKSANSDLNIVYGHSKWKTLSVEATEDDAWEIVQKITAILDQRYSHVRQIYAESKAGSRSPHDALLKFEQAACSDSESRLGSNGRGSGRQTPTTPQTPVSKHRRKFSMNPMPMLSRMLSRQE